MNDVCVCVANRVALPAEPPSQIMIMPWGEHVSNLRAGGTRRTLVDEQTFELLNSAFIRDGADMLVDYEHQSEGGELARKDGLSPAAGWIKRLSMQPGVGIFGEVLWTPKAAEMIANREYRHTSWAGRIGEDDRPRMLSSVAITNTPFVRGVQPITNRKPAASGENKETVMDKEILKALGLADGADEKAVVEAINKLTAQAVANKASHEAVCKALELDPVKADKPETIVAAINTKVKPTGDVVPKAEYDAVANTVKAQGEELATLKATVNERAAEERVANAMREGKLTQAMLEPEADGKNYFREKAKDGAEWDAMMARMPKSAPADGKVTNSATTGTPKGERGHVINSAKAEFDAAGGAVVCNKREYINEALREEKLAPLSDDEAKTHAA